MGGYDPYSASKGAAELVIASYRRSYFSSPDSPVRLASARAGNVIGGGDWALDRIVPDCIRALSAGETIPVRNKIATRPWQHVLEPLSGYLWLGAALAQPTGSCFKFNPSVYASAFNFGPELASNRTVSELVQEVLKHFPGRWEDRSDPRAVHEAKLLNLAIDKAHHLLGWAPVWPFAETIGETVAWYRGALQLGAPEQTLNATTPPFATPRELTQRQIAAYSEAARVAGLSWAGPSGSA
jgi:CDP-glucose 4,6-dehydratase